MGLADRLHAEGPIERVVGRVAGDAPGPLLLVVAGIHGNEPASVLAARRVLDGLRRAAVPVHGDVVILAGNLGALERGVRYIDRDLNRGWTEARLAAGGGSNAEDREQLALYAAVDSAWRTARGPVHVLDLHSTSAPGAPFAMVRDEPRQKDFALRFPLPVILGLLELVDSTFLEFARRRGALTLGVEAGQNDDPRSIEHHESLLWLALEATGVAAIPDAARHRARLEAARGALPHLVEVDDRHAIAPGDEFRMLPGFTNVQRVRRGELLAHDRRGPIHAARDGVLMLPLYQPQGDDGFFFGREVQVTAGAAS